MRLGLVSLILDWMAQLIGPLENGQVCACGDEDFDTQFLIYLRAMWEQKGIFPLRKREDLKQSARELALIAHFDMPPTLREDYDWSSADLKQKLCRNWEDIDQQLEEQAVKTSGTRHSDSDSINDIAGLMLK